jgi:fumarate reductase (CoM/CoB) subunit B
MSRASACTSLIVAEASCVRCGQCLSVCDVLGGAGLSVQSIAKHVLEGRVDQHVVDTVQRCALCGLCCVECPGNVDVYRVMTAVRESFALDGVISSAGYESVLVDQTPNLFSLYREQFGVSFKDFQPSSYDTVFFPGCILASYAPELALKAYRWITELGFKTTFSELCCGSPLISLGLADRANRLKAYMVEQFSSAGAKRLITCCPGCQAELSSLRGDIDVISLSTLLREKGIRVSGSELLAVHDSCRDRRELFARDVRMIISGYSLVEMEHHGTKTICCGSGGMVSAVDPDLCERRVQARLDEYRATGADHLITTCPTCSYTLSKHTTAGKVLHYLELLFGTRIDWERIQHNLEALFDSEHCADTFNRLSQARLFTQRNLGKAHSCD